MAATLARVASLVEASRQPVFGQHTMDSAYHHDWALAILHGERFAAPLYRAPLYPYFLAGVYAVLGHGPWPIFLVQAILGGLTSVVIFLTARRLAGKTASAAGALLYAFYWPAIYYTSLLLVETLAVLLYCLAFYVLVREAPSEQTQRAWFLGGLLTGLGIICRPSLLAFLPVPLIAPVFCSPRLPWRRSLARAGVFFGALAIPIAPVTAYNVFVGRDAVPIAWSDGINLHIGNNPRSDGASALAPELRADWWGGYYDAIRVAQTGAGRSLKPSEVSAYWRRQGLRFISDRPAEAGRLFLRKTAYLLSAVERPNNTPLEYYRSKSHVLEAALGLGVIAPLAALGLWRSCYRWRRLLILYGFLLSYAAGIVLFFVNTRYRLPLVPVLAVFAGIGVQELATILRLRNMRDLAASFAIVGATSIVIHTVGQDAARTHLTAQGHVMDGNAYLDRGRYAEAVQEFQAAVKIDPQIPGAFANQAVAVLARSDTLNALQLYQQELRLHPNDDRSLFSVGQLYAARGDTTRAIECYQHALALHPSPEDEADVHYNLGNILAARRDDDGAIREYSRAIEAAPRHYRAMNNLGAILVRIGRMQEAERLLRECVALAPQYAGGNLNLGALLFTRGQRSEAKVFLSRALEADPSSVAARRLLALLSATGEAEDEPRLGVTGSH